MCKDHDKQARGEEIQMARKYIKDAQLLSIEWVNNKFLLYSTENYIQYLVINHNEKEYIYVYICMYVCITESLFCTAESNTTL